MSGVFEYAGGVIFSNIPHIKTHKTSRYWLNVSELQLFEHWISSCTPCEKSRIRNKELASKTDINFCNENTFNCIHFFKLKRVRKRMSIITISNIDWLEILDSTTTHNSYHWKRHAIWLFPLSLSLRIYYRVLPSI